MSFSGPEEFETEVGDEQDIDSISSDGALTSQEETDTEEGSFSTAPDAEMDKPENMRSLAFELFSSGRYELLKFVLYPEIHYMQNPWLQRRLINEYSLREWEDANVEQWMEMFLNQLNSKTNKSNASLKKIIDTIEEEFKRVSYANFKDLASKGVLWGEKYIDGSGKFDRDLADKYFNAAFPAFIAWQRYLFDRAFDEEQSYEVNFSNLQSLAVNRDRMRVTSVDTVSKRLKLLSKVESECYSPIEKQTSEIIALAQKHRLSYPFKVPTLDILDVIDDRGNTLFHLLLKTPEEDAEEMVFNFIFYLPIYLERERIHGRKITSEEFKSLKNHAGESIEVLLLEFDNFRLSKRSESEKLTPERVTSFGKHTTKLFTSQWQAGPYTGQPLITGAATIVANTLNSSYVISLDPKSSVGWQLIEPCTEDDFLSVAPDNHSTIAPGGEILEASTPHGLASPSTPIPIKTKAKEGTKVADRVLASPSLPGSHFSFSLSESPLLQKKSEKILKEFARINDYRIEYVAGDGNCYFSAIASLLNHLFGTRHTPSDIRREGVTYLRANEELHQGFGPDLELGTFNDYLERMARDETWAQGPILEAVAQAYNVRVKIIDIRHDGNLHSLPELNEEATDCPLITLALTDFERGSGHYHPLIKNSTPSATADINLESSPQRGLNTPARKTPSTPVTPKTFTRKDFSNMMDELTRQPADPKPPFNTPERRARLALTAVDTEHIDLLGCLLAFGTYDENVLTVRSLYSKEVESEYAGYLFDLWRLNLYSHYLSLVCEGLAAAEKKALPLNQMHLLAIRTEALSQLEEYGINRFYELDAKRGAYWLNDSSPAFPQKDLSIIPILQAQITLFVLWEQTSECRVINEDKPLERMRLDLRDLYRLMTLKEKEFEKMEKVHAPNVKKFYEKARELLTARGRSLFPPAPEVRHEAVLVAYAGIFGFPQTLLDIIDAYGNTLLHRALLGSRYYISDWLLQKIVAREASDGSMHPIFGIHNKFGQLPLSISKIYQDFWSLRIFSSVLNAKEAKGTSLAFDGMGREEKQLFDSIDSILEDIPGLCTVLLNLNAFLNNYQEKVIRKKELLKERHDHGDVWVRLVWFIHRIFGYDEEAILAHRKNAMERFVTFRNWIIHISKNPVNKNNPKAYSRFVREILQKAEELSADIDAILSGRGITKGQFQKALEVGQALLSSVARKSPITTRTLTALAREATPSDEFGQPMLTNPEEVHTADELTAQLAQSNHVLALAQAEAARVAENALAEAVKAREETAALHSFIFNHPAVLEALKASNEKQQKVP